MMGYRWYQATENMKDGDYVISFNDGIRIRKCNMERDVPIGRVKKPSYLDIIEEYSKVMVISIWYDKKLTENIEIKKNKFYKGESYYFVLNIVNGVLPHQIYNKLGQKQKINNIIHELKKIRDEI